MRKIFTIGLLFLVITLQAQDLKSLYVSIPDSLSPLLTDVNRQDFGDFLSSNMKAEVKNRFGKTSEMLQLSSDYLKLRLTSVSSVEMKLLPVNDSTKIICVAKTYQGPVSDTQISFYSTDWRKLNEKDFIDLPTKEDFFIASTKPELIDSLEYAKAQADIHLMQAVLSENKQTLEFTYTMPDYLDKTTAVKVRKYVLESPLLYEWSDGHFSRKK